MIFITVGSRSFQFDRLIRAVDEAVKAGRIKDKIFAQIGSSGYKPTSYEYTDFLDREKFSSCLDECDIVITHGGTGVIVNALKKGKKVIAVPRLKEYQEVVDEHQLQLVHQFEDMDLITACYDCNQIGEAVEQAKQHEVKEYQSNTQNIIRSIEEFISGKTLEEEKDSVRVLMCNSARTEKGGMNSVVDQLMDHEWDKRIKMSYLSTHISGNRIKKSLYYCMAYQKLRKLIKKDRFDIVHAHMAGKGSFYRKYWITRLCKRHGKKVLIHLHGSEFKDFYEGGSQKRKNRVKELFQIADKVIVLGDEWDKFVKSVYPDTKVEIVNNTVHIPEMPEKKENEPVQILFLGALIERKGVIDLLNAVKNLKHAGVTGFKVCIGGSGEQEEELKKFCAENHLEQEVSFLGWIVSDQKIKLLKESDMLVLPSYNEGLPIAILEAISYALPVISTTVGSIEEAVQEEKNGYLIEPGDVDALTGRMKELIEERDKWKAFSDRSRELAETKFSDQKYFDKFESLYFELRSDNE